MSNDTLCVYSASKQGLVGYTIPKFGTLPVSACSAANEFRTRASAQFSGAADESAYRFCAFLALAAAEHGLSFEQLSPITPIAWISISIPGLAKLVTVINALPG